MQSFALTSIQLVFTDQLRSSVIVMDLVTVAAVGLELPWSILHTCTNCIVDWLLQNGSKCIPCSGKLLNTNLQHAGSAKYRKIYAP